MLLMGGSELGVDSKSDTKLVLKNNIFKTYPKNGSTFLYIILFLFFKTLTIRYLNTFYFLK